MVFYKLPSAQQILQCGNSATIINGTSDVGSTDINVFELRKATIHQQPNTDSVISLCFVIMTGIYLLESYEPCLDLDVAFGGWRDGNVEGRVRFGAGHARNVRLELHNAQSRGMTIGVRRYGLETWNNGSWGNGLGRQSRLCRVSCSQWFNGRFLMRGGAWICAPASFYVIICIWYTVQSLAAITLYTTLVDVSTSLLFYF